MRMKMSKTFNCTTEVVVLLIGVFLISVFVLFSFGSEAADCTVLKDTYQVDPKPGDSYPGRFAPISSINGLRLNVGSGTASLAIHYNYGFLVYNVVTGVPTDKIVKDLRNSPEEYPVSGDGQARAGNTALSSDGQRAITGWADPGYGTVAFTKQGNSYSGGGDTEPTGGYCISTVNGRYISYIVTSSGAIYASEITSLSLNVPANPPNTRPYEYTGVQYPDYNISGMYIVEKGTKSFVVIVAGDGVIIADVSNPGTYPNITTNFKWRKFTAKELGLPLVCTPPRAITWVSAVIHPIDGGLYLLAESGISTSGYYNSDGVALSRLDPVTGSLRLKGFVKPSPSTPVSAYQNALVASDTEVVAFYGSLGANGQLPLYWHVRSSKSFKKNLAAGITTNTIGMFPSLVAHRYAVGKYSIYSANNGHTWLTQFQCP